MSNLRLALTFSLTLAALFSGQAVQACPRIGGLIDWNCDGTFKISVVGDSIVAGVGDTRYHNRGGYVLRLQKALPAAKVISIGFPGINTYQLLQNFTSDYSTPRSTKTKRLLRDSDLIILDAGRNDYWEKQPASFTVRNLQRLIKLFQTEIGRDYESPPMVAVSYLLPTKRLYQRTFIAEVNEVLLALSQPSFPVEFHFDTLAISYISWDGLHPTSPGYTKMESIVERFVRVKLQREMRRLRPDTDRDGVSDHFEILKYRTDPEERDTDGDTFSDGNEIFVYYTDPLDPHSFPVLPTPTLTPSPTPTPSPTQVPTSSPTPVFGDTPEATPGPVSATPTQCA